jgi:hypothetical protein
VFAEHTQGHGFNPHYDRKKNHRVTSMDAEKILNKLQHLFMIKALKKLEI